MPLLHRVAALNVLLVLATVAVTVTVLAPSKTSSFALDQELGVLLGAVAAVVAANVLVLRRLTSETELVISRVAQEALTNVARHSRASDAEMSLCQEGGCLRLIVRDRGRGLAATRAPGTGMRGMRERATLIGAKLEISNLAPGRCEVRLDVPLDGVR